MVQQKLDIEIAPDTSASDSDSAASSTSSSSSEFSNMSVVTYRLRNVRGIRLIHSLLPSCFALLSPSLSVSHSL